MSVKKEDHGQQEVKQRLLESERKYRLLAENSIDCIWTLNKNLIFTYLSPSLEAITGFKPEEWVGTPLHTHFTKKEYRHAGGLALLALKDYKTFKNITFETRLLNKDNEEVDVEITGRAAHDENGKLTGLQGSTKDISERKQSREALERSEQRLSTLMSNLPGMAYKCRNDEDWTMEFVSDGCMGLTGFEPDDLLGNARISYAGLIHPEDRYLVWKSVDEGLKKKKMFRLTYRIFTKKGDEKWVFEQGRAIFPKNAEPYLEGFITDISERKMAEEELVKALNEKSVLLSEIHHRVKNNMQLIISLLHLQKSEVSKSLEPVLDDIIERIRIFADIHQDLYQSDRVTEINISEHVRSIFRNLKVLYSKAGKDISLDLNIPNPLFSLDTAIPLGLMINELISNSLKHAFDGGKGMISISIIRGENDKIKSIQYTDSGSRLRTNRAGFGTVLLDAMAVQLQLKMTAAPDGRYKFSFHA